MHVKEATVNINDLSMSHQNDIRFARKIALVKSISIPQSVNYRPDDHFGLGVAIADARHIEAALFLCENVRHGYIGLRSTVHTTEEMPSLTIAWSSADLRFSRLGVSNGANQIAMRCAHVFHEALESFNLDHVDLSGSPFGIDDDPA